MYIVCGFTKIHEAHRTRVLASGIKEHNQHSLLSFRAGGCFSTVPPNLRTDAEHRGLVSQTIEANHATLEASIPEARSPGRSRGLGSLGSKPQT